MNAWLHREQRRLWLQGGKKICTVWFVLLNVWVKPVSVLTWAAGDPVLPPHPVHWDWWNLPRQVQHRGVLPDRHPDLRGLCQRGRTTGHLRPQNKYRERNLWGPQHLFYLCDFICMCQVQAADSVLVIGGGSTGVEMAAEIKTEYPEKKVNKTLPPLFPSKVCFPVYLNGKMIKLYYPLFSAHTHYFNCKYLDRKNNSFKSKFHWEFHRGFTSVSWT